MLSLVIGATGIIGNHVVRALLEKGHQVRVFSRGITPSKNLVDLDVERVTGDLYDTEALTKAMKGCEWVFHTAPYYPTHTFNVASHVKKAMDGTQSVLHAVEKNSVERFVFTSSLTTIGKPRQSGALADETCLYDQTKKSPHPYFAVKYLMEEEVRKRAQKGEIAAVIVNPTGCFGPYELKPRQLCLIPQLMNGKIPAYVDHELNVVDVADVGRGHVLAAQKGHIGERYILGGHNVTVKFLLEKICEISNIKPPRIKVPLNVALVPAWISEILGYYVYKDIPAMTILGLRFIQHGQHLSIHKAIQELGYTASSLDECFSRALDWYRKIGYC